MHPVPPKDFLSKAAKAIDLNFRANQRIRRNRDTIMPYDISNPPEITVSQACDDYFKRNNGYSENRRGYSRGNHRNQLNDRVETVTNKMQTGTAIITITKSSGYHDDQSWAGYDDCNYWSDEG